MHGSSLSTKALSEVAFTSFLGWTVLLWRLAPSCNGHVCLLLCASLEPKILSKSSFGIGAKGKEALSSFLGLWSERPSSFTPKRKVFEILCNFLQLVAKLADNVACWWYKKPRAILSTKLADKTFECGSPSVAVWDDVHFPIKSSLRLVQADVTVLFVWD